MMHQRTFLGRFGVFELLLGVGLTALALGLVAYKVLVLGYTVATIEAEPGYAVELSIEVEASGRDVGVSTLLPLQTGRQIIRHEENRAARFETQQLPGREIRWEAKDLSGSHRIEYAFFAQTEERRFEVPAGLLSAPAATAELAEHLAATEQMQCEEDDIVATAWELMPANVTAPAAMRAVFDFVAEEIEYLEVRGPTDALTALRLERASCNGKNRLLVSLMRARGIPARFAKGLILENNAKRTTHAWSEVYLGGQWIPFCPTNDYFARIPAHYLELGKDDRPLFRHSRAIGFDWEWNVTPRVSGMEEAVAANARNPLNFLNYWVSLEDATVSIQLIMVILLIPIAASVVSFARSVVGLHTFGTFMPSLIAVSFLQTGYLTGSLIFMAVMATVGVANLALLRLRLLHLPRLVIILTVVVMTIMLVSVVATQMGIPGAAGVSLFPIAILSLTAERFSHTIEEEGLKHALSRTLVTYLVSAACFLVVGQRDLQMLVAAFPELLLLNIAFNLWIGSWHGIRLSEYVRFWHLLRPGTQA